MVRLEETPDAPPGVPPQEPPPGGARRLRGTVDDVEGQRIKLAKNDPQAQVELRKSASDARSSWQS